MIFGHGAIRRLLVPSHVAARGTRRAAVAQFLAHGVHLTEARTGVLIYIDLAHRRVEIVADDVIDRKVDQAVWDALADVVASAASAGRLAEGLVTAVERAGAVLAEHFPPTGQGHDELQDRVVEIA
jgi:putative membrane protein